MEGFERTKDKVINEGEWDFERETIAMWNQMTNYIRKVVKDVLVESKEKIHNNKETWWLSVEV